MGFVMAGFSATGPCGCCEPPEDYCGVIPQHDLIATLTERDGEATMEVTLTYYEAIYDEDDPPGLIEPERWEFVGDTFPPLGDPEGVLEDAVRIYCIPDLLAIAFDYDGTVGSGAGPEDVTVSPFHVELSGDDVNLSARYSSIIVDDPEA